jgi:hypothetical protein
MEGLALEHNEMILLTDSSNEEYRPPIVVNKILISSFSPESNSKYPVGSISGERLLICISALPCPNELSGVFSRCPLAAVCGNDLAFGRILETCMMTMDQLLLLF